MKFENSEYYESLKHKKIEFPFGHYYACEKFFIGEMHEGIHFDWKKAKLSVEKLIEFYGVDTKVGFISNRINSYSIDPSNWARVEKQYSLIVSGAIVMYNSSTYMNASIEKQFSNISIKRCMSLNEAIEWMFNLNEFK